MKTRSLDIIVFIGIWLAWAIFLSALVAYIENIPFIYAIYCNSVMLSIAAVLSLPIIWVVGRSGSHRRNPLLTVLVVIVGCFSYSGAWIWLSYSAFTLLFGRYFTNLFDPRSGWIFLNGVVMCGVIFGISYSRRYSRALHDAELKRAGLQVLARESELRALRSQINPHFLFNAINSVYAMIESNPKRAKDMLVKLSELLRLSLSAMNEEIVPFEKDWHFAKRYLDIERIRFGDRLHVITDIDAGILKEPVPSLLLQPIVENAVKHGVARSTLPVTIAISARRNRSNIDVLVRNTGGGTQYPSIGNNETEGYGLQNLAARLTHIYGTRHRLVLTNDPEGGFQVWLSLPAGKIGGAI